MYTVWKFGKIKFSEKRLLIFVTIVVRKKNLQKWAYPVDYLRKYSTDLDQLFNFDRYVGGDN